MTEHKPEDLAGQTAILKTYDNEETVTFAAVQLTWAGGIRLHSHEPPTLHPEIKGILRTDDDYSHVKDAELILMDGRVFTVSFLLPHYFEAHEPSTSPSRTRLSYE